jgi:prophage regulatory protein
MHVSTHELSRKASFNISADEDRLIAISEVERVTGFKKSWLYKAVNANEFPQPVKCGYSTRFSRNEVTQWVRDRLASRALGQPWKR